MINRHLRNLLRRARYFLNASTRRRSASAKLGWEKRREAALREKTLRRPGATQNQ